MLHQNMILSKRKNMKQAHNVYLLLASLLLLGLSACSRDANEDEIIDISEVDSDFVETEDPNRFMAFLNRQAGLPAGDYTIVVGSENIGDLASFSVVVESNDESVAFFNSGWTGVGSGGMDETSADNPSLPFTMPHSGQATIRLVTSSAASLEALGACLYLLDAGGTVIAGQDGINLCTNPVRIEYEQSTIDNEAHAKAYYAQIDPLDTRDTLIKWKQANGFGQPCGAIDPCEVHVIFRDTKDLGYGRSMFARRNDDGSMAVFVENFQVDAVPGQQYTELNLDSAIADSRQWHFGSNAIEFSTYPYGPGEPREGDLASFDTATGDAPMFTKYYTFRPVERLDPSLDELRLDLVDLDSRGFKSMPGPCISCHGGKSRPLLPDGTFPAPIPGGVPGDVQAHFQALEVHTFGFSDVAGYTRPELEAGLRFINQGVMESYRIQKEQYVGVQGYWDPTETARLLKGWYGGNADNEDFDDPEDFILPDNTFDESYVPPDWRPNVATGMPPVGSDTLFLEVVGPNCVVCHFKRGTDKQSDIDFSSFEKFIGHASQVERFIYDKGVMPLGLLNFDAFWDNSSPGRAELLASFLPGFSHGNEDGTVLQPGRPVAVPVAPRSANVPLTISAEGSPFSTQYFWRIEASPAGSSPTLSDDRAMRPVFNTDMNGDYTVTLITYDGEGQTSEAVSINIAVSGALKRQADLSFAVDIQPVLDAECISCHAAGAEPGVPAYWTTSQVEGRDLYKEIISRVNFLEPLESLLLRKPSGNHHFGNCRSGFDLSDTPSDCLGADNDRSNYDTFLTWILQGAAR